MAVVKIIENEALATGDYKICVVNTEMEDGQFGPQVKFTFDVKDSGGRQLLGWASMTGSTNGKLFKWAKAFGMDVEPGDALDTDDMIGKTAIASVVIKTKEDGTEFNKIDSIRPLKVKKSESEGKKADPFEGDEDE